MRRARSTAGQPQSELSVHGPAEPSDSAVFADRSAGDRPAEQPQLLARLRELESRNDELRRERDRLAAHALRDPLTGTQLRSAFSSELVRALARLARQDRLLAVLFLDVDRLKQVNDVYGHAAGDALLTCFAERLRATVRPSDVIARIGGDEFAVLLEDLTADDEAEAVAGRILQALDELCSLRGGHQLTLSASIGIAVAGSAAISADDLLSHADAAMYSAKEAGRGRYARFDAAAFEAANARVQLEAELRRAIVDGQLLLHYQPIVQLATGEMDAVEALLRWRHPTRGVLNAASFIDTAEASGLLARMSPSVADEACQQLVRWDRTLGAAAPRRMFLNLSVSELVQPGVVDSVQTALASTGLDPGRLVIEVTETGMHDRPDSVVEAVDRLLELGCSVAIDDFGTGYSGLSRLAELPADYLKIDQSFVRNLGSGPQSVAIIAAVLLLAHNLRKSVVAEGVEDDAALATLSELGCEYAQGYHLGRPMPPDEITALLRQ